jgi:hypothetical protein
VSVSALFAALKAHESTPDEALEELAERVDDVNGVEAKHLVSLLHSACQFNVPAVVAALIRRHANVNALTRRNDSPLHFAVLANAPDCVRLLIGAGHCDATLLNANARSARDVAALKFPALVALIDDALAARSRSAPPLAAPVSAPAPVSMPVVLPASPLTPARGDSAAVRVAALERDLADERAFHDATRLELAALERERSECRQQIADDALVRSQLRSKLERLEQQAQINVDAHANAEAEIARARAETETVRAQLEAGIKADRQRAKLLELQFSSLQADFAVTVATTTRLEAQLEAAETVAKLGRAEDKKRIAELEESLAAAAASTQLEARVQQLQLLVDELRAAGDSSRSELADVRSQLEQKNAEHARAAAELEAQRDAAQSAAQQQTAAELARLESAAASAAASDGDRMQAEIAQQAAALEKSAQIGRGAAG